VGISGGDRGDRHGEERARVAVLEVTKSMLNDVGYQQLRVETVAARAGVPRSWLRRWWTTRPLLVAETVQRMGGPPEIVPTGDVRADVRAIVLRTAAFLANRVVADAMLGLTADAARDPVAAERLATLLSLRRAGDSNVLLSAIARGDLRPDTDVPMVLDVLFGTLLFRLGRGAPPTPAVVDALVELVLAGQGTRATYRAHAPRVDARVEETQLDGQRPDLHAFDDLPPGTTQLDGHLVGGPPDPRRDSDRSRSNGYGPDHPGSNGSASDGYGSDGFGANSFGSDGFGLNGHGPNGSASDGYGSDGYGSDRYRPNGYGTRGHGPDSDEQGRSGQDHSGPDHSGTEHSGPNGFGRGRSGLVDPARGDLTERDDEPVAAGYRYTGPAPADGGPDGDGHRPTSPTDTGRHDAGLHDAGLHATGQ
jgi:AcrR family transcriptional regulator